MLVLDLFAGEGGATQGYMDAGFEVIAVDTNGAALRRNPASIKLQADWRKGLELFGHLAVLIHASPPCQGYSVTKNMNPAAGSYPKLIEEVRAALVGQGHYVIENVEGAPLRWPHMLCGTMFDCWGDWHGDTVHLRRHRLFEATFPLQELECNHIGKAVTVAGHGRMGGHGDYFAGRGYQALCRQVMGIDWMTREGMAEAIPPAYSTFIGQEFLFHVEREQEAA